MSALSAMLLIDDETRLPPEVDLSVVREQSRTIPIRVANLPTGTTLTRLIFTAKENATDLDANLVLQKVVTADSDLAVDGQITDDGAGTLLAFVTVTLTPADLPDTVIDTLVYQVWCEVTDASLAVRQAPCLRGTLRSIAPMPFTLP